MKKKFHDIFHSLKKLNKAQKTKLIAVITIFVVGIGTLLISTNKPITDFMSTFLNKKDSIQYAELEITDAKIYTEDNQLLKEYEQQKATDLKINNAIIKLSFNLETAKLYQNGNWFGEAIYVFPKNITAIADNSKGIVYSNNERVGTFVADSNHIILKFYENKLGDGNIIYGDFSFYGSVDFSDIKYSSKYSVAFSDSVHYDFDVKLCTKLKVHKAALEPVINQENQTIKFSYEIELFSPDSTNSQTIDIKDILVPTTTVDEKLTWSNIKIVWKDKNNKEKKLPTKFEIKNKNKKEFTGTLPAMDVGDSIIITYSVTEQADDWDHKIYKETNTVTVQINDKLGKSKPLTASVDAVAGMFNGNQWYDISIEKEHLSNKGKYTEDYSMFYYQVEIKSTLGTKNNEIEFEDKFTIDETLNGSDITYEDLKVYKVSDNLKQDITKEVSLTSDNTTKSIKGKLPALKNGEYYLIEYALKITNVVGKVFHINNTATCKTKDLNDTDSLEVESYHNRPLELDYEISVEKNELESKRETNANYSKYFYEVIYKSLTGTKNHEVEVKDILKIDDTLSKSTITIEDFHIKKVSNDGTEEDITDKYSSIKAEKISKGTNNIEAIIFSGKLPPLKANEQYKIEYSIKITRAIEYSFNMLNVATVKTGYIEDSAEKKLDVVGKTKIENDIQTKSSSISDRYNCPSKSCGSDERVQIRSIFKFIIKINTTNSYLKDGYNINLSISPSQSNNNNSFNISFYKEGEETAYDTRQMHFPLRIEEREEKYYVIDQDNNEFELSSPTDSMSFETSNFTVNGSDKIKATITIKSNDNIISETNKESTAPGYYTCQYDSCPSPPPPYRGSCYYSVLDDVYKKAIEYSPKDENDHIIISWETTINMTKNELSQSDFQEYLSNGRYSSKVTEFNKNHHFTLTQLKEIKVYGVSEDKTKTLLNKEDYKISAIHCDNDSECSKDYEDISTLTDETFYSSFKISFIKENIKNKGYAQIVYNVDSTGILEGKVMKYFSASAYNDASRYSACIGNLYSSANILYEELPYKADSGLEKYNYYSDGTTDKTKNYSYLETTDKDNIYFYYKVVLNKEGLLNGNLTYIDQLPDGVELVQDDWEYGGKKCENKSKNYCKNGILIQVADIGSEKDGNTATNSHSSPVSQVEFSYDEKTNQMTLKIPEALYTRTNYSDPNYLSIVLYYKVHVVEHFEGDAYLTNKATLDSDNANLEDHSTNKLLTPKFDKYFDFYEERKGELTYYVKINKDGNSMLDGQPIKLIDTITYMDSNKKIKNIGLKKVSIYELVDDKKGNWIADLDAKTNKIENGFQIIFEIPDEKALYLEYTYKIELYDDYPATFHMSNHINILGNTEEWANESSEQTSIITGIKANAYTNVTNMSLFKVDTHNVSQPLKGATFRVEKYTGKDWKSIGDFTTNEDGYVEIGEQHMSGDLIIYSNVAYRAKEIKAPTGYALDSKYNYIYVYNPLIKRELIPKGFDKNNVINNKENVATVKDYIINIPTGDILNIVLIVLAVVGSLLVFLFVIRPKVRYEKVD